jgi:hypothetical protein
MKNGKATGTGIGGNRMGIYLEGTAVLTMTGGQISESYDQGLAAPGAAAITLSKVSVKDNGVVTGSPASGITLGGGGAPSLTPGSLTITGGDITGNGFAGINAAGSYKVSITGTAISNNDSGIMFGSSGELSVKGATLSGNINNQVQIGTGANAATKIEFLANGTTPTTIARTAPSTVDARARR